MVPVVAMLAEDGGAGVNVDTMRGHVDRGLVSLHLRVRIIYIGKYQCRRQS